MSLIAATVLADNRESVVADAINSALPWIDRLLLIDTGITDGTRTIAERLAGDRLVVESFPWRQDFAAARNFALAAACQQGASWALTLDTDERLAFPGYSSRDELQTKLDSNSNILTWLVAARDGSYSKERFIRVSMDGSQPLIWKGRTHECLTGAKPWQRAVLEGVGVSEARKTPEQFQAKLVRDLKILLEQTAQEPAEPRWWYYLGQTYEGLERFSNARDSFRRCAEVRRGWAEQAAWACYRAANCCLRLQQPEEALELCTLGLARQPQSPELAWLAGYVCYRLRRFEQAITWSQLAITLGNYLGQSSGAHRISFRHLPAWYEGPFDVLRFAYAKVRRPELAKEAEEHFVQARQVRESVAASRPAATEGITTNHRPRGPRIMPTVDLNESSPSACQELNRRAGNPHQTIRVAVLGLYRSGSSATAAVLNALGVKLGHEFLADYFEAKWLSEQLRRWWNEPQMQETVVSEARVRVLADWIADLDCDGATHIGAKHPLLTLCGPDLIEAWGRDTKFIWTWRPVENSIASLKRRGWWPSQEERIQQRLWSAAHEFFATQAHMRVEFDSLLKDPHREVGRLIEFLGLEPTVQQRLSAANLVIGR